MKEIKFSHVYQKFIGIDYKEGVKLIEVVPTSYHYLSPHFIEYDTRYENPEDNAPRYYDLPKDKLIILIFQDTKGSIFTTIRRYTNEKFSYYKGCIGEVFNVVFRGEDTFV